MATKNRNAYRAFLLLSFIGVNLLILFGIGSAWSYLNTGADRSTMLHLESRLNETYLPKVTWSDTFGEGRPLEKQTLTKIEKDYKRAWYVRNLAYKEQNDYGLDDYYTDSALVKFKRILDLNKASGIKIKSTTISHNPDLEFYSADGQLVAFKDNNVTSYSQTYRNDSLFFEHKSTANYRVIMLLEDGFWRIRHLQEIPSVLQDSITENNSKLPIDFSKIRGVNYYPQKTPWDMFGENFDGVVVRTDFERIRKMGLNMVRIFVPYENFGKNIIDQNKLEQLKNVLNIALETDLKVMVTLFDFYGNYDIADWTLTHRHAEIIVNSLKNHKALLAWDVKNEPDLDFDSRGFTTVTAWLKEMIAQIKSWDPEHDITIGWSSTEAATNLTEEVDLVSFHYYKKPEDFVGAYHQLQDKVNNKPLMLQEYGLSSYSGVWNAFSGSEEKQAAYYKQMQEYISQENLPFVFWTLFDFNEVPTSVVGRLPWRKTPQRYFGCIDEEGSLKPSYQFLKQ